MARAADVALSAWDERRAAFAASSESACEEVRCERCPAASASGRVAAGLTDCPDGEPVAVADDRVVPCLDRLALGVDVDVSGVEGAVEDEADLVVRPLRAPLSALVAVAKVAHYLADPEAVEVQPVDLSDDRGFLWVVDECALVRGVVAVPHVVEPVRGWPAGSPAVRRLARDSLFVRSGSPLTRLGRRRPGSPRMARPDVVVVSICSRTLTTSTPAASRSSTARRNWAPDGQRSSLQTITTWSLPAMASFEYDAGTAGGRSFGPETPRSG